MTNAGNIEHRNSTAPCPAGDELSKGDGAGIVQLIILHLFPGLLACAAYYLLARPAHERGLPTMLVWLAVVLFVNIPFEHGWLLHEGCKRNKRISLKGTVAYARRMGLKRSVLWTIGTFAAVLALYILSSPLTQLLEALVLKYIPEWFIQTTGMQENLTSRPLLWVEGIGGILVFVIGIPIVEELYFRGYLLPRLSRLGALAVPLNSLLFALYHFTTPWLIATRTLITLPLGYAAERTRSLIPSIIVHSLANSISVVAGFIYLLEL